MQRILTEKIGAKQIVMLQRNVDATDGRLNRRLLSARCSSQQVYLWIDCAQISCLKDLGFCNFLSQVLLLKKLGVIITLLDMPEAQRRLVTLLHLEPLFSFVPGFEEAYETLQAS